MGMGCNLCRGDSTDHEDDCPVGKYKALKAAGQLETKPPSSTGSAGLTMDRRMIKMTPEEIIKAFKHELRRTLGQQQADKWRVSYDKGWYTLRMIGTSGIKERRAGMMRRLEVLQAYPSF